MAKARLWHYQSGALYMKECYTDKSLNVSKAAFEEPAEFNH